MNKEKEIVPKLRFPEYVLEWKIKKFDFEFLLTNSFSRAEMNDYKGVAKNIHYGDILTKFGYIIKSTASIPFIDSEIELTKFNKDCYLQNGDIIIADTAEDFTAGKTVEIQNVDCPVLAGQHTILCRPKSKYAARFLGYYFNTTLYHNRLIPLLTGTKVYSISKANIKDTLIVYPEDLTEQQKVADCLSSIDDLIEAENRKLEALKKYKKGLTQKLFPAEGKTQPEWRFPEFLNDIKWAKGTLADICTMQAGKFINASEISNEKKRICILALEGMGLEDILVFLIIQVIIPLSVDKARFVEMLHSREEIFTRLNMRLW